MNSKFVVFTILFALSFNLSTARNLFANPTCAKFVCIDAVKKGDIVSFYASNKKKALPVTLSLQLELENMELLDGSTDPVVVEGGTQDKFLFSIFPKDIDNWHWHYDFTWVRGDHTAIHNHKKVYSLPFARDRSFIISKSCGGSWFGKGLDKYTINFKMAPGTAVHAARKGHVVDVISENTQEETKSDPKTRTNFIAIQHSDKTLGLYSNIQREGALVEIGDFVHEGDKIGFSGGSNDTAYLNFKVAKGSATEKDEVTLQVNFNTSDGLVSCPPKNTQVSHPAESAIFANFENGRGKNRSQPKSWDAIF